MFVAWEHGYVRIRLHGNTVTRLHGNTGIRGYGGSGWWWRWRRCVEVTVAGTRLGWSLTMYGMAVHTWTVFNPEHQVAVIAGYARTVPILPALYSHVV